MKSKESIIREVESVKVGDLLYLLVNNASGQIQPDTLNYKQEDDSMYRVEKKAKHPTVGVYEQAQGGYIVQAYYGKDNIGRTVRKSKRFKNKEDADDYAEKLREKQEQGNTDVLGMTFDEFTLYALNSGFKNVEDRTKDGYKYASAAVRRVLGKKRMREITGEELADVFDTLRSKYVDVSLKKVFNSVRAIFKEAEFLGEIEKNPFDKLKCPKSRRPDKAEREAYTDEEIKTILKAARDYPNPIILPFILVLDSTGMRPSEARGLEWEDLDVVKRTIRVKQSIIQRFGKIENLDRTTMYWEEVGRTKSKAGVRTLSLTKEAVDALKGWREYLDTCSSVRKKSSFIFNNNEGEPIKKEALKSLIRRFVDKYEELQGMGFLLYRFRHTYCTRLKLKGMPIDAVKILMGDSSDSVINKVYTHITNDDALRMLEKGNL